MQCLCEGKNMPILTQLITNTKHTFFRSPPPPHPPPPHTHAHTISHYHLIKSRAFDRMLWSSFTTCKAVRSHGYTTAASNLPMLQALHERMHIKEFQSPIQNEAAVKGAMVTKMGILPTPGGGVARSNSKQRTRAQDPQGKERGGKKVMQTSITSSFL